MKGVVGPKDLFFVFDAGFAFFFGQEPDEFFFVCFYFCGCFMQQACSFPGGNSFPAGESGGGGRNGRINIGGCAPRDLINDRFGSRVDDGNRFLRLSAGESSVDKHLVHQESPDLEVTLWQVAGSEWRVAPVSAKLLAIGQAVAS